MKSVADGLSFKIAFESASTGPGTALVLSIEMGLSVQPFTLLTPAQKLDLLYRVAAQIQEIASGGLAKALAESPEVRRSSGVLP